MGEQGLAEALGRFGLAEQAAAVLGLGVSSLVELLQASDDIVEQVHDLLEDAGVARPVRKDFRRWLAQERALQSEAPPLGSASSHLYGLAAHLNDKDTTSVEAATILRVDINPFSKDSNGKPQSTLRMATGTVERQVQAAADGPVPVVSLVGPTGVGKSFLTSLFMDGSCAVSSLPLIAHPDQHVPTSAHVSLFRGAARPSAGERAPLLLIDFEGEDGQTPKNLVEGSMRRLTSSLLSSGFTEDALQAQLKATAVQRLHVVKEVLPSLAYLISDVVLFVDEVEPRRKERADRIRHFAEQAHEAVESLLWRPALVLIQNKWAEDHGDASYDITCHYEWMVEDLETVFSSVTVLRVPVVSARHKFEDGVLALHRVVHTASLAVQEARRNSASLFSEPDFWFGFEALVEQLSEHGASGIQQGTCLGAALSQKLTSHDPLANAIKAMELLGPLPTDATEFQERVCQVFDWYAYSLAGQARFQGDVQCIQDGLQDACSKLWGHLQAHEPCAASMQHDGKQYRCSQRRAGHGGLHRHPSMIRVKSPSFLKQFIMWKDRLPCVWPGSFASCCTLNLDVLAEKFKLYAGMPIEEYETAFAASATARALVERRSREDSQNMCLLCLRAASDLTMLPDPVCHHYLCWRCVLARKRLSKAQDRLVCPFCARASTLPSRPEVGLPRVLTLDGGGVRGLCEILVLQRLEQRFAPLPVTSLFDLIVGTSAGGLVSLGLLARKPLEQLRSFVETLAKDVLDVSPLVRGFRHATGQPVCNTGAFVKALERLFKTAQLEDHKDQLPWCCCTLYETSEGRTWLAGNFPCNLRRHFQHYKSGRVTTFARATAAAPTFLSPCRVRTTQLKYDTLGNQEAYARNFSLVDGGVEANCPAKWAACAAEEMKKSPAGELRVCMEALVSLGTGLPPAAPHVVSDNVLHWGGKLVDIATDAERQWRTFVHESPALQEVPKLRVNPPNLGGKAAFSSESVPGILSGMESYFASAEGAEIMDRLFHLTYAKLWELEGLFTLIASSRPVELRLVLRDLRFKVQDLAEPALRELLLARGSSSADLEGVSRAALVDLAQKAFKRRPISPAMPGCFAYIFDGEDCVIEGGTFALARANGGMPLLNVVWRTERLGDFPINGFPRLVQVVANKR